MKNKDKEFIEKNTGNDKLRGRPVRLNKQRLIPNNDNYAEVILFGDLHLGYPTCNMRKAKNTLDYALENKAYVLIMGDMMESGLTTSIGNSIYRQKLNPQKQMEAVINLLQPLADAKLIIGYHEGNHEQRITNATGIDISKIIARILNVPYLGYACWSILSVNGIRYTMYSQHGTSGARFKHTKLKAIMDQAAWINSDILCMGHVHSIAAEPILKQRFDRNSNKVIEEKQIVVLTGAYLEWDNSYAQMKGYPIVKTGSPKLKLIASEKDVHIRL
jgi:UDP-2,3-diacylglucosamine pyrophosphatase LpxH